ncbi:MAG: 3-deoxy-7-phosphoheptulonate synthase [Clostridia bacterium]|nr:3-deoxy-7-phosphoheptulonate synthase [Clostridia bacterium]
MSLNLRDELVNKSIEESKFKYAGRNFKEEDTVIEVAGVKIGGDNFTVFAGPCSVESKDQIVDLAGKVRLAGCQVLRGGAFKPRTSPHTFQGLGDKGIRYLVDAKEVTGLPVVSEIMDPSQLELFKDVDILQIGAKNMQNFALLKAVGKTNKPVLLKRGFSNTLEELLFSAEYIMSEGNHKVILCERGIRTFETSMRNTFDITAIALLRQLTHLPVIADPSHSTGESKLVSPVCKAAVAAGCQGLLIETHDEPQSALCDGFQAITIEELKELLPKLEELRRIL